MTQCKAITEEGKPCQIPAPEGEEYCHVHRKYKKREQKFWQKSLQRLQKLPDMLKWLTSLIGSAAALVISYNQLASTLDPLLASYLNPLPSNLVVFVSPDPFTARSYLSILADSGFETRYLDLSQIDDLPSLEPGVVIIGSKNGFAIESLELSQGVKNYLTGNVKIIGMGWFGAEFFQVLDPNSTLSVGHAAHGFDSLVSLDAKAPQDVTADLPIAEPINLYDEGVAAPIDDLAVYDQGSLPLVGAQGIARHTSEGECRGHYWPVVKQGNHVLWGYSADAQRLTESGKILFVNVVKHVQSTPYEIPELERQYFEPGIYRGTLGCNFIGSSYHFKINRVGDINLRVASRENLALILNGPGQVGYYARVDQVSPELTYQVTAEELSRGDEWFATVTYFGPVTPEIRVGYELEITYPFKPTNVPLWSVIGLFSLGLLIFILFRLLKGIAVARYRPK